MDLYKHFNGSLCLQYVLYVQHQNPSRTGSEADPAKTFFYHSELEKLRRENKSLPRLITTKNAPGWDFMIPKSWHPGSKLRDVGTSL